MNDIPQKVIQAASEATKAEWGAFCDWVGRNNVELKLSKEWLSYYRAFQAGIRHAEGVARDEENRKAWKP